MSGSDEIKPLTHMHADALSGLSPNPELLQTDYPGYVNSLAASCDRFFGPLVSGYVRSAGQKRIRSLEYWMGLTEGFSVMSRAITDKKEKKMEARFEKFMSTYEGLEQKLQDILADSHEINNKAISELSMIAKTVEDTNLALEKTVTSLPSATSTSNPSKFLKGSDAGMKRALVIINNAEINAKLSVILTRFILDNAIPDHLYKAIPNDTCGEDLDKSLSEMLIHLANNNRIDTDELNKLLDECG